MAIFVCAICGYMYDEGNETVSFDGLPDGWTCPVCGNGKEFYYEGVAERVGATGGSTETSEVSGTQKGTSTPSTGVETDAAVELPPPDPLAEPLLTDIVIMAQSGESVVEPMRTREPVISWDEILFAGAQIAKLPLNEDEPVTTTTVVGPRAKRPLEIESPILITHMSFGALSKEAKLALARGSAAVKTAMSSGEGGILRESMDSAYRYIFEYVPNRYSVTDEYLQTVDAVEIKLGQSAKPGMGGHLPGNKVTDEIAAIRGFSVGVDITSPAHHDDIRNNKDLAEKIAYLRDATGGKPIGVKLAAGNLEGDLEAILSANPDFITVDGRAGATGAAPKFVKRSTSVPTPFALHRARKVLNEKKSEASLLVTGGLRVSSDFAKALAMGADAVAIGTSALIAVGCRQYRMCHTGRCPMGIATQDPELRKVVDVDEAAVRVENFLRVSLLEVAAFARLTGNCDVHAMSVDDLWTTNSEVSTYTDIRHV